MYLICTGGMSFTGDLDENHNTGDTEKPNIVDIVLSAKKISMHLLGLLRNILTPNKASLMVMHTLVPLTNIVSPENNGNIDSLDPPPPEISVVQKLVEHTPTKPPNL